MDELESNIPPPFLPLFFPWCGGVGPPSPPLVGGWGLKTLKNDVKDESSPPLFLCRSRPEVCLFPPFRVVKERETRFFLFSPPPLLAVILLSLLLLMLFLSFL